MTRTEKLEHIQNVEKETDLHDILMDLLPKMGYDDVTLTHERGTIRKWGRI